MNFKKRSEMCKPEVKEQKTGTKFSGDIKGGRDYWRVCV